jgi:uncharacterized coiled-coil DUF342 family protein
MESLQALVDLRALAEKIEQLIVLIKELRAENASLKQQYEQLQAKAESLESSMLAQITNIDELHQERALTKKMVDDLIKNIDSLVRNEQQS